MTGKQLEAGARDRLDNWKFWVGVAYFGLAFVVVWSFFLNRDISREQANRAAQQKAAATSQLASCYTSVKTAPDLLHLIGAIRTGALNSIITSQAAIETDPSNALNEVRRASIKRNRQAVVAANHFHDSILATRKTKPECDALADRLGLPRQPTAPTASARQKNS